MPPLRTSSDRDFEAQNDARTLADAAEVRADKPRMGRAAKAATKMAKEQQVRATALKSVARKVTPRKGPPRARPTPKPRSRGRKR